MGKETALAFWLAAVTAMPLCAQAVGGVVLEEGSEAPVDGAMVVLMDQDGDVVRRVLSDATGRFALEADHAGPHLIRIDRIGYESVTTSPFDVPEDGTFRRIRLPVRAVELRGLSVEGATRCQLRPELGSVTARVWEEARKALQAAAWTLDSGMYRYTLMQFERPLDARGNATGDEVQHTRRGWAQAPYVSAPAEELVDHGFVQENDDTTMSYFAPDADVLLSDAFLDSHCMSLERERDGMVGLDFAPVRGRRSPDIEGTLWLESKSASLRRIEFRYVNHPVLNDADAGGGDVSFARMPNGSWVVRDWSIRMPLIAANRDDRSTSRGRPHVVGYLVQGGTLRSASNRDGATVLESASGTVAGKVVDSLNAKPVSGGVVTELDDPVENRSVPIGSGGSFVLAGLTPGDRHLQVTHPSLDTLALAAPAFRVPSVAGEMAAVRFRLPGVSESLRTACYGSEGEDERGAVVYGRVRSGVDPAASARVRLRVLGPQDIDIPTIAAPAREDGDPLRWRADPEDSAALLATLDGRGVFLVCDLPRGARIEVEAEAAEGAEAASAQDEVEIVHRRDVLVETIRLGSPL